MFQIISENLRTNKKSVEEFETKVKKKLDDEYKNFLIRYNGGEIEPNVFKISEEEGESAVNIIYGLNVEEEYDELSKIFDKLEGVIPENFLSIADDPGGNQICLGVSGEYVGKIYLWIHDSVNENEMNNMFFLNDSFNSFLFSLYEAE